MFGMHTWLLYFLDRTEVYVYVEFDVIAHNKTIYIIILDVPSQEKCKSHLSHIAKK